MNTEEIQNFLRTHKISSDKYLKITFKKRDAVYGIFIQSNDTADLESKNFWRIVTLANLPEWYKNKNISISRIFNGSEFVKLAVEQPAVVRS